MVARKFTDAQAVDAILKNYGNITAAARALNVDHSTLFNRLKKKKALREARKAAEEQLLDLAENSLWSLVRDRNLGAICFSLKCKGKARGWVEKQDMVPGSGEIDLPSYEVKTTLVKKVASDGDG